MFENSTRMSQADKEADRKADEALNTGAWDRWTEDPDHNGKQFSEPFEAPPRYQIPVQEVGSEIIDEQIRTEDLAASLAIESYFRGEEELVSAGSHE